MQHPIAGVAGRRYILQVLVAFFLTVLENSRIVVCFISSLQLIWFPYPGFEKQTETFFALVGVVTTQMIIIRIRLVQSSIKPNILDSPCFYNVWMNAPRMMHQNPSCHLRSHLIGSRLGFAGSLGTLFCLTHNQFLCIYYTSWRTVIFKIFTGQCMDTGNNQSLWDTCDHRLIPAEYQILSIKSKLMEPIEENCRRRVE